MKRIKYPFASRLVITWYGRAPYCTIKSRKLHRS